MLLLCMCDEGHIRIEYHPLRVTSQTIYVTVHTKNNHKSANFILRYRAKYAVRINYAEFQVSTPWGLGRSWQAARNLSAVCGTYFGSSSRQKSIVHPRRGKLLSFTGLLERTYTVKELLLKLHT